MFISRDPIELAGGENPFAYTDNDPINQIDVDGLRGTRPPRGYNVRPGFYVAQINHLVRQIRRIDPSYRYQTVRRRGQSYSQRDVDTVTQHLENARSAGFCGNGAAYMPNFMRNGRVSEANLLENIIPQGTPNTWINGNGLTGGSRYEWTNPNGVRHKLWWHGPNPNAPAGSNSALNPTVRLNLNNRFVHENGRSVRDTNSNRNGTHIILEP